MLLILPNHAQSSDFFIEMTFQDENCPPLCGLAECLSGQWTSTSPENRGLPLERGRAPIHGNSVALIPLFSGIEITLKEPVCFSESREFFEFVLEIESMHSMTRATQAPPCRYMLTPCSFISHTRSHNFLFPEASPYSPHVPVGSITVVTHRTQAPSLLKSLCDGSAVVHRMMRTSTGWSSCVRVWVGR